MAHFDPIVDLPNNLDLQQLITGVKLAHPNLQPRFFTAFKLRLMRGAGQKVRLSTLVAAIRQEIENKVNSIAPCSRRECI